MSRKRYNQHIFIAYAVQQKLKYANTCPVHAFIITCQLYLRENIFNQNSQRPFQHPLERALCFCHVLEYLKTRNSNIHHFSCTQQSNDRKKGMMMWQQAELKCVFVRTGADGKRNRINDKAQMQHCKCMVATREMHSPLFVTWLTKVKN